MKRATFVGLCAAIALPVVSLTTIPSEAASAPITGTVFRDYNHDGVNDAGEPGWPGVTVTATDPAGVETTTTSAGDGTYSLAADDAVQYRVEFTWTEAWLESGPIGADNASSVQFLTGGETGDFSVSNPADYCDVADASLGYSTTCYINGDPSAGSDYSGGDAVISVHGTAAGFPGSGDPAAPTHYAANTLIGSTYGLSWQPSSDRLFTSAFLKRHVGLGSGGIDAIYAVDTTAAFGSASSAWYSAVDAGTVPDNATRGMPTLTASPASIDPSTFGQIYKVGWGDIDISADESTLYAVNLFDRNLYAIDIAAADGGSTSAHTNLGRPAHTCTGGVARPFALEIHDGKVWMSITCTAETSGLATDLSAAVYSLDIAAGTWAGAPAIDFPLDYSKGCTHLAAGCGNESWTDTYSEANFNFTNTAGPYDIPKRPQPMVSDLEIDRDGYLTIAMRDRQADQFGHRNYTPDTADPPPNLDNLVTGAGAGDILLASPNGDGTWTLESAGVAGAKTTSGVGTTNQGPGGPASSQGPGGGEFYWAENADDFHSETSIGSLALAPGRDEVAVTLTDPLSPRLDAAGIGWFDTANGSRNHSYEVFRDGGTPAPVTSGKANGLGDLEAMCPPAPIQIGNRVWFDANNNGVQDAGEAPIPGVTITLTDGTTSNDVITAADGSWSFSAAPGTSYTITVDSSTADVSAIPAVTTAADLSPTSQDSGSDDVADSDMDVTTQEILVTTGAPGANNHTLDAGFVAPNGLEIGNLVWMDTNNNGIADGSEPGISGVTVELWIDTTADGQKDTKIQDTVTDGTGHYNFTGLAAGTYFIKIPKQSDVGEPLQHMTSSTPSVANADNNADNDDNAVDPAIIGDEVMSEGVVLGVGEEPPGELLRDGSPTVDISPNGLNDADSNLTVDFGFYPLATLGDVVWFDDDRDGIQDAGEAGVPGVTVSICDADMNPLQTLVTDADGKYLFTDLPPGEYMVCFDLATLPADYEVTSMDIGGDDAADSDANAVGKTTGVVLGPGDANLTLDMGIFLPDVTTPTTTPPTTAPPTTVAVGSGSIPVTGNNSSAYLALFGSISIALGLSVLSLRKRVL